MPFDYQFPHMTFLSNVFPAWVEADPFRSNATDALGLQAVSDLLANQLLPGLSVLTTRARYFTFLCWARAQCKGTYDERQIHHIENRLLFSEALQHPEVEGDCGFVGKLKIKSFGLSALPSKPDAIYKVPVWRSHRASMVDLGLVERGKEFKLTDKGKDAAKAFSERIRPIPGNDKPLPKEACLSRIGASTKEKKLVRECLALSDRMPASERTTSWTARAEFVREARERFRGIPLAPETILHHYEGAKSGKRSRTAAALQQAAIWEYLSIGLNGVFVTWARAIENKAEKEWRQQLASALRRRGTAQAAIKRVEIDGADNASLLAMFTDSLRRAQQLGNSITEIAGADAHALAASLLSARTPGQLDRPLDLLLDRHRLSKGVDAWILRDGKGLRTRAGDGTRWKLPPRVSPHAYRFVAFDSLCTDVGGL